MKLYSWYISPVDERCYPVEDKMDRVKYIAWFPNLNKVMILDMFKSSWKRFMFESSETDYSRDCIKAIFNG
jgi:hypothetical protein